MAGKRRDRSRAVLMSEFSNVGTIGALLGGFALESLSSESLGSINRLEMASALCMYLAVHMCTFSAISSWWLYRHVNLLTQKEALAWGRQRRWMVMVPTESFAMGAVLYISGVSLIGVTAELNSNPNNASNAMKCVVYIGAGVMCLMMCAAMIMMTPVNYDDDDDNDGDNDDGDGELKSISGGSWTVNNPVARGTDEGGLGMRSTGKTSDRSNPKQK
jgi:hypothetical protein